MSDGATGPTVGGVKRNEITPVGDVSSHEQQELNKERKKLGEQEGKQLEWEGENDGDNVEAAEALMGMG
eukprot:5493114-Prymnesium_polylepis.1